MYPSKQTKPLLLCVEDDPTHLKLRKAVLEKGGFNVIGVTTANDAIKAVREVPVCAVIADHMLQGTTGTELAKALKKIKPDVPIIMYSGTLPNTLEPMNVYINKGEPTEVFIGLVREIVKRYCS